MKIRLLLNGKTKPETVAQILKTYEGRINKYIAFETVIIPDLKNTKGLSPDIIKRKEAELIKKNLSDKEHVILLDEKGKEQTSTEFADSLQNHFSYSSKPVCFVVGGAYGFDNEIYSIANQKLALAKMTFSHQIIRILFAEQLYRALTIIHGDPYHND